MSKKKEKQEERDLEKLYFLRSPVGYGYHAKQVEDVPADLAKEFKNAGIARPATQTLPPDIPGHDAFMKAGIETIDEIKKLEDPTKVNGIGDSTAKDLAEWFASEE